MGYTHYYSTVRCKAKDVKGYMAALPTLKKIVKKYRDIICYEYDKPKKAPKCDEQGIYLNGREDDGHETFVLNPTSTESYFCKTARKPYDLCVCELLLVLNAAMPNFELSSDGFYGNIEQQKDGVVFDGTWNEAIENVKEYGIVYEGEVVNRRDPYCDLGLVLVSAEEAVQV